MRIGFYISGLQPDAGGAYSLESSLLHEILIHNSEHELFIYCYRDLPEAPRNNQHFVRLEPPHSYTPSVKRSYIRNLISRIYYNLKLIVLKKSTLAQLVLQHKIDLIWFLGGFEAVPVPFVFTVLDCQHRVQPEFPEVSTFGWTWEDRNRFLAHTQRATFTVTGTHAGAKQIENYFNPPSDRLRVIPIPIPLSSRDTVLESQRPKSLWTNSPFIFYPAQFWPHKNHYTLLYALKIINSRNILPQPLSLVLCGSDKGNRSYIFQLVRQLGLESQVQMLPFIDQKEVLWLYDNAEALVFPSLFGPDNLPPLEAFSRKCPVIAARNAGAEEQLGNAALYFDPYNETELADVILKLLTSKEVRSQCIELGLKQIQDKTARNYVEKVFQVIDEFKPIRRLWGENFPHSSPL